MTIERTDILKGYVQKCASDYSSPSVLNLTREVQKAFEKNSSDSDSILGVKLGDVILGSNMIQLQGHQETAFYIFWTSVANEVKSL